MLEIIAMTSMLVDHAGAVFYPHAVLFRIIGRIAFPAYCFLLVKGYRRTKSFPKYVLRLLIIALISQPIYIMMRGTYKLNVIFTLIAGLLIMYVLDSNKSTVEKAIAFVLISLTSYTISEYGFYGILVVLIFRYMKAGAGILLHSLLNIIFLPQLGFIQLFSILGTTISFIMRKFSPEWAAKPPFRTFYRIFYPVHMAGLLILKIH